MIGALNPSHLHGKARKTFMYTIELSVVIIAIVLAITLVRTFGSVTPPITLHEPAIVSSKKIIAKDHDILADEVHITRDVTYNNTTPVVLTTQLINKDNGDETIDLPDAKIIEDIGTRKMRKLYYVGHLTQGKWCIKSSMYWTPFLSIKERTYSSPESCFMVE